jgi:SAM-dependent methyltransferase
VVGAAEQLHFLAETVGHGAACFHPMCGTGRWATELLATGVADFYVGVDINFATVERARDRHRATDKVVIAVGDVFAPWPTSAATCNAVLLTYEAVNFLTPSELQVLSQRITRELPHVRWIAADFRDPFPRKGCRIRAQLVRSGPLTTKPHVMLQWRRPIGSGEKPCGVKDTLLSPFPWRVLRASLWEHPSRFVRATFVEAGFGLETQRRCPQGNPPWTMQVYRRQTAER